MIFLGIDCGTQSTKVVALDGAEGIFLAQATAAYDVLPGLPAGHLEQNPSTWIEVLEETISGVLEQLGARRGEVAGIGVSGQQHGFVPLDRKGEVIRPAKLWCDTSTAPECDEFRAALGGRDGLIRLIGNDMLPGFTAPKILWLKNHEPENFRRLAHILLPHDYLNFYLTGAYGMEYGDASGSALMDVRTRTWSAPVVEKIGGPTAEALPALRSSLQPAGSLRADLAARWGLKSDIVVSAGGGDNMMGAIGTGNVRAGRVTASLGTSGTIYAYARSPVIDPQGEIAAFCDSTDSWLPLLCTMNVTVATEAVRAMFNWSHHDLEHAVNHAPPGSGGILFLPYLQGERTPNLPNGQGVFHGLNPRNMTPGHMARAVMEGTTLGLAYGLQRLRTLGVDPREIRLTGGGSKSSVWRKICATIFGCPVVTMQNSEGAAFGAALQALAAVRPEKSVADWADELVRPNAHESTLPDGADEIDYAALLEKHTRLTRCLAEKKFL